MKSFRDYISKTERQAANPVTGDVVSFVINEEVSIDCDVVEHGDDYIVLEADDVTEGMLTESQCVMERIARYGAVGNNRAMGFTTEDSDVDPNTHPQTKDYGTGRDEREEELDEGVMSEIDIDLHNIASSEDFDMLYDAFNGKMGQATQSYLERMFAKVAQHNRLHPDDQQEDILEIMMDQIVDDFGDGDIDTPAEPAEPVAEDFMSRMLELAGVKKMQETAPDQPETNAAHTDPLAAKAADLAPVGTENDPTTATTVDEDGTDPANAAGQDAEELEGNLTAEAKYAGREVKLGKPMKGDVKKFKVFVKNPKTGNVKKVNFGDPNMEIRRDDPKRRKSFRARHGCGTPRASDRTKAAYWSCRMWSKKPVSKIV